MAEKTPVRVVFNASNVATGLAEFQTGDAVGVAFGGTGLNAIGSAGQVLKVNAAGSALEFGAEGDISITNLVAPTNSDLTLTTSGTGNIVLDGITVRGTTFSAADSSSININEGLIVDGTLVVSGQATLSGLVFPTSDGSANQFLKTDGSGNLSFADVSLGDFSFIGSTISNSSNADLTLDPSGTGSIKLNAATDVTGAVTITTTTTDDSFLITTTEASNSAAPVFTFKRNSSSPADADYLGRIKFKGENDADQEVQYGSISGKILDASDGTEDGAIEFNVKKAGSNVIAVRLNSDELKLLNGTTLDVDGAGTFAGSITATSLTTNTIASNGSNADLSIQPSGTGDVLISALRINGTTLDSADSTKVTIAEAVDITGALTFSGFTLPTSDGTDGQALVTDGSKTLSFGTVGAAPVSDDSAAVVISDKMITSTARTIDSFHTTFQDSVLYYVVSNDFNEDAINVQKVSVCHNDSASFISSAGAQSKASATMTAFTTSVDNSVVRVKAASSNAVGGSLSFYKFGLGDNTSTGTSNNVIISQNTDVDSASESLVTFAHADFRGAKLFISINNSSKTEVGNTEALVVHDGTDAFISQFGGIQSGDNPLLTLTAAISGSNVVVSAAGLETNLRVTIHAIMLKDTMTSNDGTYSNAEAIAPVTISSSATAVDELVETTANGAVYYLVSKNASEGEFAVNEVFFAMGGGDITVASGPFVSTKGTNQLNFTADYKEDVENTGRLLASSTSGGSTTVSAYRINALAK